MENFEHFPPSDSKYKLCLCWYKSAQILLIVCVITFANAKFLKLVKFSKFCNSPHLENLLTILLSTPSPAPPQKEKK